MPVYDTASVGLLVPWPAVQESTRSATLSSVSSRGASCGRPVADQATDALPVATGSWSSPPGGGTGYTFRVQRGGHVGPFASTWAWKDDTEATTSYRGHDWPTHVHRCQTLTARSGETALNLDMVTLPSGRVVGVQAVLLSGGEMEIRAFWLETDSITGCSAGDEIVIVTEDTAHAKYEGWNLSISGTPLNQPSVAYWQEEGRVLCAIRYVVGSLSSAIGQVALFESTDEGASWSLRNRDALVEPYQGGTSWRSSHGAFKLRRCGSNWSALSCYASNTSARYVEQWAGTTPDHLTLIERSELDVVEIDATGDGDGLQVIGVQYDGAGSREDIVCWRLGSAFQPLSETESVSVTTPTGGVVAGFYPTICLDTDGLLWAVYLDSGQRYTYAAYSLDRGATWLAPGYYPLETAANANLECCALTYHRGGLLYAAAVDNGADWNAAVGQRGFLYRLGGWDNAPLPEVPTRDGSRGRLGFGLPYSTTWTWGTGGANNCLSWFPTVLFTSTSPVGALTGAAPVVTIPDGADPYAVFTDAGAGSYVTWTPTAITYTDNGIIAEVDCKLDAAGTSALADNRIIQVRLPDVAGGGANIVEVSVRLATGSFDLYDERAGAVLQSVALAGTTRRLYRLVISGTDVALYYRQPSEQVWTQVTATTSSGASAAAERVRVGATGVGKGQSIRFYGVRFVGTVGLMGPRDPAQALAAANVLGRGTNTSPDQIYGGVRLQWKDGPLHPGHTWTLSPRYEYGPELLTARDHPSQSDRWQSSADGAVVDFVYQPAGGSLWRPPGSIFGMLLYADGVETLTVAGRDSTGTYQTLITANPNSGFTALSYTAPVTGGVTGYGLRPNTTGSTASRPWAQDELAGGWVRVITSGAAYRITGNTEGLWGPNSSLKPTLYLEGWDGAEPSTGTLTVYPPVSLHVVPERDPGTGYDRIRVRIAAAANTVEGRYTAKVVLGSVYTPGRRYSHGRVPSLEPKARGVETPGGRVFYDPEQPLVRYGRFAWADPYGTGDYYQYTANTGPEARLVASGGTQAASLVSATHLTLAAILRGIGGPARTLVYIPQVPATLSAWSTSDPERFLYGRIVGNLVTPRPWGDEGRNEEVMISEVTVEEAT